ncbi:hypothetical protein U9M48_009140 [Paspalum notatum var. saurae]|uniref:Reverse transcriptase domain-containing protein n=1 Tax=Paspalum notatum var. saurae TaxID=547442 RepID=A0AAQ3SS41_PASNO
MSIFGSDFGGCVEVPAVGASGGILLGWRQRIEQPVSYRIDTYSVSVKFCNGNLQSWWLTCVYGPQGDENKIAFLQELRDIRSSCLGPWVVMGDFNLIYKAEDKNNSNLNRATMGRFKRLIDDLALKEILTSHTDKEEIIYDFFNNLLGKNVDRSRTVNLEELGLPAHDLHILDIPISEEEVWNTIKQLPSDKAPGPDGFTGRIYKACWPILKEDLMAVVSAVWSRKFRNFWLLNNAYITLLLKKEEALNVKDFRPISLVHSVAKLITKILANRLASKLDSLVSPNQSAFIKGRFIQDFFMLVQQTARFLHQQKQPRALLKLDISKAFDSVSWPSLLEVSRKMGFGPVWCDIISGMLSTSSTQILLNDVPGEVIRLRRGLRQGDPLSPMLFILVMDVLCLMINKASNDGFLQPLSSRTLHHRISIYADDVVVFLRPAVGDIRITLDILSLFGDASGLQTNVQKSSVFPIQCNTEERELIQENLPCLMEDFPCKYLGIPLSLKKLSKAQIQILIDKIADQLPGWKAELMTRAGRVIQVQFVLTAMTVSFSMAVEIPWWAIKAIDKIRRGFLWRGRKDVKGGHCLVAWEKVQRPKELGGLGISNLQKLGWALRLRWLWLQKTDPSRLWALFPIKLQDCVHVFFSMAVETSIGNGKQTLFWKDRWLQGHRIEDLAPNIAAAVPNRRANRRTVKEALATHLWVQDIQGSLSVTMLTEYLKLWDLLADVALQDDTQDTHHWRLSSSGQYSSKSAYANLFHGSIIFEAWERIWKSWAPNKCRFFMWLFWFTLLNHFFLHNLAPSPEDESFDNWWKNGNQRVGADFQKGFNSLVILGSWSIWKHRNSCVFDGVTPSMEKVLTLAKEEATFWSLAGARGITFLSALEPGRVCCTGVSIPFFLHFNPKIRSSPACSRKKKKLPGWKAPLLSKAGRLVVVKSVLSSTPIHLMLALDLPKWVIKTIDKRRGFLWKGHEQANGGNCMVSWANVQRLLLYGGLGVLDLERLGWAIRIRWLWFMK